MDVAVSGSNLITIRGSSEPGGAMIKLSGALCLLMISHLALAQGVGSFYGKFRPLDGVSDAPGSSVRKGRYSGAAGYYPPKYRPGTGAPQVVGPGSPNPPVPGATGGYYGHSPQQQGRLKPRFRPDPRYRNGNDPLSVQPYGGQPGLVAPGYRFRPQGHSNRTYGGAPGEARIIKRQPS